MSNAKKQVWLRTDQVALVVASLKWILAFTEANEAAESSVAKFAKAQTARQIREVLPLFDTSPKPIAKVEGK